MDQKIQEYYEENKESLIQMFKDNESSIEGRICHPSIILLKILSELIDIHTYMEIGVHNGGSMSMLLASNKNKNITMHGIDLFEDMYDVSKHLNHEKFATYQYFRRDDLSNHKTFTNLEKIKTKYGSDSTINLIQGNSYFDETEEKFKDALEGELDLLFIDGDHTLDGVKNDFERYSKYVKKGGYIVFDDYHYPITRDYVDGLSDKITVVCKFKCELTQAIDVCVQLND